MFKRAPYKWASLLLLLVAGGVLVWAELTAGCAPPCCRNLIMELRSRFMDAAAWRRQRLVEIEADTSRYDVVMLGDSLTEGGSWCELLTKGGAVANHGISGDTSSDLLRRIALTDRAAPRRVFLMIGVNDVLRGHEQGLFDRIGDLLTRLSRDDRHLYLQSILLTNLNNSAINATISKANEGLRHICRARLRCSFVDVNAALARDGRLREDVTTDGLHLNRLGYEEWAALILAAGATTRVASRMVCAP